VAADKVLVTGASGFVGSAVAHALVRSGYRVRALLRQASSRKNLGGLDLEIAEGDMRDPLAVARAMAGVRFLFHVAADYRLWARKPQEILHNNQRRDQSFDANSPGARGRAHRLHEQRGNHCMFGRRTAR
jgi:dihydroflavonol-4-reductase